jgi:hypothetical protein
MIMAVFKAWTFQMESEKVSYVAQGETPLAIFGLPFVTMDFTDEMATCG